MTPKTYWIDEIMKNNYLGLFEEIIINGRKGPKQLWGWFLGEQSIIEQSISELVTLQAEEDIEEEESEAGSVTVNQDVGNVSDGSTVIGFSFGEKKK